jgi:hypothetical protein
MFSKYVLTIDLTVAFFPDTQTTEGVPRIHCLHMRKALQKTTINVSMNELSRMAGT